MHRLKESFVLRVFSPFVILIIILSAVFSFFFVHHETGTSRKALVREGEIYAGLLAGNVRTWVFAEDKELLREAVQEILQQTNVLAVAIYTSDNQVIFSDHKKVLTENNEYAVAAGGDPIFSVSDSVSSRQIREKDETIEFFSPVILESFGPARTARYSGHAPGKNKNNVIGYVMVAMDKRILRQEIGSILFKSAIIISIFMFCGTMLIYLIIQRFTRPLLRLTEEVQSMGLGNSFRKVPVESADEIGRLAQAFNNMSDTLLRRGEEKQQLEEELRHAQTMEALGTLARGIAHDFNNILATIRGSVYMIEKKLPRGNALRQYTEQVQGSIMKAKHLINGLLAFSRVRKIYSVPLDLNSLIIRLRPVLSGIAGEAVELRLTLSDESLIICADPLQVEQVLMNLCSNARDAMPEGGQIAIGTGLTAFSPEQQTQDINLAKNDYVLLSVSDTGTGIDERTRTRIFEPFFTTKETGIGTGLGLSIVFGIVQQHKGHIEVRTKRGEGTQFNIYFPFYDEEGEVGTN